MSAEARSTRKKKLRDTGACIGYHTVSEQVACFFLEQVRKLEHRPIPKRPLNLWVKRSSTTFISYTLQNRSCTRLATPRCLFTPLDCAAYIHGPLWLSQVRAWLLWRPNATQMVRSRDLRLAFFRMRALGRKMPDKAACLGVHKRTLQRWTKLGPQPSMRPKERPSARKLSPATCQALKGYSEANATTTLSQAAHWLKQQQDICLPKTSVAKILQVSAAAPFSRPLRPSKKGTEALTRVLTARSSRCASVRLVAVAAAAMLHWQKLT